MAKESFSPEYDQYDPKVFRESLGSFGTTTKPGGNQLEELQAKIRQGVKHVELHLASTGKGQFNVQDVPDKYGFEQRRTIMQLAKLNQQTLSVHGTFDITSFSGLSQGGFDDSQRLNSMKEIDETLKFAAETAKSGAVVFHIQGEGLSTDRGELNLSKSYLNWLKEKAKTDSKYRKELENLEKNYFTANPLNREFVSDPEKAREIRAEFSDLKNTNPEIYNKYIKKSTNGENAWELYYEDKIQEKIKLSPDMQPLVVIGDKIGQTQRGNDIINLDIFKNIDNFSQKEREILKDLNIDYENYDISTVQRTQAFFTNGFPEELKSKFSENDFEKLKSKVLITYGDILKKNNYLQAQADEEFHKKLLDFQIKTFKLQKDDLNFNYDVYENYLDDIKKIELEEKTLVKQINQAKRSGNLEEAAKLRKKLNGENREDLQREYNDLIEKANSGLINGEEFERKKNEIENRATFGGVSRKKLALISEIGQLEYQKLENYNEMTSQINEKIKQLEDQKRDVKAVTDVTFDKNVSALGHLGIKALRYQLDLKVKSKEGEEKVKKFNEEIRELEEKYENASNLEKNNIHVQLQKKKYELRNWIGVKDYSDIDLVEKPLYLAPENMLPGMGSLTSLEEYKAAIRMGQESFAKKILSNESDYKKLREEYERETGVKIKSHEDAIKLAKRHLSGTFDNAHAGVWLKHFKREEGESEEHRIERFNQWLNTQAEEMAREGIIKHVHFNDTQAKDDDHNLLGSGILDLHDMRERLRKAGIKEPLIVEAGGRGANRNLQVLNALEIFNPTLLPSSPYRLSGEQMNMNTTVSDWVNVQRNYRGRPQYSQYGMNYNTFRAAPSQGQPKGDWSGTSFL